MLLSSLLAPCSRRRQRCYWRPGLYKLLRGSITSCSAQSIGDGTSSCDACASGLVALRRVFPATSTPHGVDVRFHFLERALRRDDSSQPLKDSKAKVVIIFLAV
mmetsp:Transcript_93569/g.235033  ORF Transcript_93569/g.235033 Transcript_93569/m.235033 type:complete len:104 (+) Transcript_93569:192-503(+)